MQSDPDLLPLADAALAVGKSVDTLRRWKRAGLLAFEGPDAQGRALVQRAALLLAAQGHARDTAPTRPTRVQRAPVSPPSIVGAAAQGAPSGFAPVAGNPAFVTTFATDSTASGGAHALHRS